MKNNQNGIKEFKDLVLCDYSDKSISIHVRASLENGKLIISGDDIGDSVQDFWTDDDYEYWYELDEEGTQKLLKVINGLDHPVEAIKREFSGTDGCKRFREICEENRIPYGFHSYA